MGNDNNGYKGGTWAERWTGYLRDVCIVGLGSFLLIEQAFAAQRSPELIGAAVTILITPAWIRARRKNGD